MKDLKTYTEGSRKLKSKMIAKVINNNDPKNRNRIQVDILGITDEVDSKGNYPWAEQEGSISAGSSSTVGVTTTPSVGELVYVEFLNGSPSHPVYTGIVRGASDSSSYFDGSNYVIHTPSGDVVKVGTGDVKVISGSSVITVTDGNITLDNGSSTININGDSVEVNTSSFNVNSSSFTHNGTNVGDSHTHSGVTAGSSSTGSPD